MRNRGVAKGGEVENEKKNFHQLHFSRNCSVDNTAFRCRDFPPGISFCGSPRFSGLSSRFLVLWHLLLLFTWSLLVAFVPFIADPYSHLPGATVILNTFTKLQFNFYSKTGRRQASHQPRQRKINKIF